MPTTKWRILDVLFPFKLIQFEFHCMVREAVKYIFMGRIIWSESLIMPDHKSNFDNVAKSQNPRIYNNHNTLLILWRIWKESCDMNQDFPKWLCCICQQMYKSLISLIARLLWACMLLYVDSVNTFDWLAGISNTFSTYSNCMRLFLFQNSILALCLLISALCHKLLSLNKNYR